MQFFLVIIVCICLFSLSYLALKELDRRHKRIKNLEYALNMFRHVLSEQMMWCSYEFPILETINNQNLARLTVLLGEPGCERSGATDVSNFREELRRMYQANPGKGIRSKSFLSAERQKNAS